MARVWKFGDNIDTDTITPAEYIASNDPEHYAAHAMEPVRPEFANEADEGDIVVAGRNFGSGSSRETAPKAFEVLGMDAVVAQSFSRIFYRNAINIGLPVYICPEAYDGIEEGHDIAIDHTDGVIVNQSTGEQFQAEKHPAFIQEIIDSGGLAGYREQL